MKTGLTKKQKATNIYFNEADSIIEVCTYNTSLKNRLTEYAGKYPSECRLIDDDGNGCLTFEVNKGRFGFKLTAPYTEKRRNAASELAKKNTERLSLQIKSQEKNEKISRAKLGTPKAVSCHYADRKYVKRIICRAE